MESSSYLKIKNSKISGKGVFATKPIKKGQSICFLEGEICSLAEMIKSVDEGKQNPSDPLGVDDEIYIHLNDLSRTFNHSCDPNAFIKRKNQLIALKNIEIDEEITYDYSTTMNDNEDKIKAAGSELWVCKCNCGSDNCRGRIDQFKTLPREVKIFYIKNKFAPDFILKNFKNQIL